MPFDWFLIKKNTCIRASIFFLHIFVKYSKYPEFLIPNNILKKQATNEFILRQKLFPCCKSRKSPVKILE